MHRVIFALFNSHQGVEINHQNRPIELDLYCLCCSERAVKLTSKVFTFYACRFQYR